MATEGPLQAAILAMHARWRGERERFPSPSGFPAQVGVDRREETVSNHGHPGEVPRGLTVPTLEKDGRPRAGGPDAPADWDEWEERAAIVEFDGQEARQSAERQALRDGRHLGQVDPADDW